ncbi:uncharacterized protein LOC116032674 isoform X6 [Ipomoea triloba]|uniref:uncharacterized protein LOC116032674 isoform X6 n=1 Tax=Ipomoea triloba TaxID=35885 RepID=UPI00125E14E5|nr:uncharacterized protein LOC116032674 isoform X6 [Ipomoea triloba]
MGFGMSWQIRCVPYIENMVSIYKRLDAAFVANVSLSLSSEHSINCTSCRKIIGAVSTCQFICKFFSLSFVFNKLDFTLPPKVQ